jgi:uncharacterized protein (DUF433 family)
MRGSEVIVVSPKIMSGTPCFRGTRVPVSTLFESLARGMTIDEILQSWPTLNRADVMTVLSLAGEKVVEEAKAAA